MLARLREMREASGLSQRKLAEMVGVSQQSINKYENHNIEPDIGTLIRLANVFGTSVDYLIGHSCGNSSETNCLQPFRPDEIDMLRLYDSMSESQRDSLRRFLHSLADGQKKKEEI